MGLSDIQRDLATVHGKVVTVKKRIRSAGRTLRLLFDRRPLDRLEDELDGLSERFAASDAQLIGISPPGDINSRIMVATEFSVVLGARHSAHTVLAEAYRDLSDVRNHLNFLASLLISITALAVAVLGFAVG